MIYLDNAATTPMSSAAISAMTQVMQETYGNPSSIHGHGRQAGKLLREARQELAGILGTKPQHIFFTSGGTESNNTAIIGYCLRHQNRGKHIITTAIEHHAVLEPIEYLVENFGFEVTILKPDNQEITADQVKNALREDTILVSTMYVNNETGTLLPIAEIGQILKVHSAAYHVDAVQAVGKLEILPEELGIDFLSASAHKFHGPKGIGFLYAASTDFDPYLHGGDQEQKKRAGTENLPAIIGMVAALKDDIDHLEANFNKVQKLQKVFLSEMAGSTYYLNQGKEQLPYVLNIGFPGQRNDLLLLRLDLEGISISTGSACTAGVVQVSHVLQAFYGEESPRLHESVRVSISPQNTEQEMITLAKTLKNIIGG
nr:cysteine desulfurase family protein [Streptococcus infantis]